MRDQNNIVPVNKTNEIQEMCHNPKLFSEYVKGLTDRIDKSQSRLEEINGRGWWKRKISSTTKDLSAEMIEHAALISDLFTVLQVVSYMTKGNSALLFGLMDSLNKSANANNKEGGFLDLTKSYLQQLLDDSKNASIREKAIKKLLVNCIQLNNNHNQLKKVQEDFIVNISTQYESIKESNSSFQKTIEKLQSENEQKLKDDQKAFESNLIKKLEVYECRLFELEKNLFWKSKIYHLLIGILSIVSFILCILIIIKWF